MGGSEGERSTVFKYLKAAMEKRDPCVFLCRTIRQVGLALECMREKCLTTGVVQLRKKVVRHAGGSRLSLHGLLSETAGKPFPPLRLCSSGPPGSSQSQRLLLPCSLCPEELGLSVYQGGCLDERRGLASLWGRKRITVAAGNAPEQSPAEQEGGPQPVERLGGR